jgi:ornithine carbamoyltransferase
MTKHFLIDTDLTSDEQTKVLDRALEMKARPGDYRQALSGRVLAMIFQKSSTRTRVSFEAGMVQLGGHAIFLSPKDIQMGRGEPVTDTGRVLARYCDAVMIRTFAHEEVQTLAKASTVPVVNGLDDLVHPCQALADLQTMREAFGTTKGQQLVYVGDGNNVSHSLMLAGALAGAHVRVVCPKDYSPKAELVKRAQELGKKSGSRIEVSHELAAVEGADAVYTDVWASMGQEGEAEKRKAAFAGWEVDQKLMRRAKKSAIFLHCLPAHRGEEVSAEVIDGPQSRVFDQAENRLHAQKALLTFLLGV